MTVVPSPQSRIPEGRPLGAPVDLRLTDAGVWCSYCETKAPRSLSALHRCRVCGRSCCGSVVITRHDVVTTMRSALSEAQRVWDPESDDERRRYAAALARFRDAETRRRGSPPVG